MIRSFFKSRLLLALIIFLGLILRIVWINSSPASLYGDELTIALDANSLLKTGQDQLGNTFPLTFQMGAGRPAGYVYGSIPFIAIFGSSALGVRSLSILSGLGIIILLYFLGRKLFSKEVGLGAAFIAAVSPWEISLSRGGFEAHFALMLFLLGVYFLIKAKEKPLFYILSALSFGLTLHTYPTYKVNLLFFIPLLFWVVGIKNIFEKGKKYFTMGVIIFLVLGFIGLSQSFIGGSERRFLDINFLSREDIKSRIEQKIIHERNTSQLHKIVVKFFHNKPFEYTKIFLENYLQNFSLDFLVLHGDRNPRHNMATMGQVFLAEAILIIVGILTLWKQKKLFLFLFLWLVIAPIPTAIIDLPHALRSSSMLPPLILLSAIGLVKIINTKNKTLLKVIFLIFTIQFVFFIQKMYFLAPNEYGSFWSYSAKLASEQALQNKNKVKYIFLSSRIDNIEFAYPLYGKVDPSVVISQNKISTKVGDFSFKKFDNVYIGYVPSKEIQKFLDGLEGPSLYIGIPDESNYLQNYQIIQGKDKLSILIIK